MDSEDRDKDKKRTFHVVDDQGSSSNLPVTLDIIKTVYIAEGISVQEISSRFNLPVETISRIVTDQKLDQLRSAYIREGLMQIQNVQLTQSKKLMDLENNFKKMRLIQIEKVLEDYSAYYARHGHFYKVHPLTGEVLKDSNGIPMQLKLPNLTKEIMDLKESVSLSEGLKNVLTQIDSIINNKSSREAIPLNDDGDGTVIDATFQDIFKHNSKKDEE